MLHQLFRSLLNNLISHMLAVAFGLLSPALAIAQFNTGDKALDSVFTQLLDKNFAKKAEAVDALVDSQHARTEQLLINLVDGNLRYIKSIERPVFIGGKKDKKMTAIDALSDQPIGEFKKRAFKKFPINNAMRRQIRAHLATQSLKTGDATQRLAAVNSMVSRGNIPDVTALHALIETEQNGGVKQALIAAITIQQLDSPDTQTRLTAIAAVTQNLSSTVRNKLVTMQSDDGDVAVRDAATLALTSIDEKVRYYGYLETLFFGLSLGSVLVLAAIGLAITFGVMGVINMAHGELIMLGAYTTWALQQLIPGSTNVSLLLAIPAAFLVSATVGVLIERGVVRFLYGRPLDTLLATFGLSLILQQLVRTGISAQNVPVSNASFLSGSWQINSVLSLTYSRLYIFLFCLIVFVSLVVLLKRTTFGLRVRAVSQNRSMARAMGIPSRRVDAMTFALGAGIAGVAGVALSQLTNVGPNLGQSYIVDSFMVVVFGGVGNLWGTLIAGLGLGIANKVAEPFAGAVLAKILVLIFIILFIQKRPRGLFPQRGRSAEHAS